MKTKDEYSKSEDFSKAEMEIESQVLKQKMNEKLKAYKNTKNIQNTDKNPHEIVKYLLENFIICIDNVFTDIENEMDKKNTLNKKLLIKNKSNNITKMLTIIYEDHCIILPCCKRTLLTKIDPADTQIISS